jgi:hypothetical protein
VKYIRFGIYILLGFFLLFPFLILPRILKVKAVECYNQYGLCSGDFITKVNSALGKSINDAKKKVIEEFKSTKFIDSYSFRFKLPATLRVDILLKKPKYALLDKNTNEIAVLDNKGMVLEKTDKTNLPFVVTSDSLPNVGESIDDKKRFSLELIYAIYYLYQVKSGEIVNDSLEVIIPETGKVIFPLEGERDILLGSMKLILSRLNQEGNSPKIGKVKEIDLRYKNPVIRYD